MKQTSTRRGPRKNSIEVDRDRAERLARYNKVRAEKEAAGTIYYLQAAPDGLIKIGTTNDLATRLRTLMASCPVVLTLLRTHAGSHVTERSLHELFYKHRSHGEWFYPHPEILAHIKATQDQDRRPVGVETALSQKLVHPKNRLTSDEVRSIYVEFSQGARVNQLAKKYDVEPETIYRTLKGGSNRVLFAEHLQSLHGKGAAE